MKFYIAGRTAKVPEIKEMIATLSGLGHEVTHDWTELDIEMQRPYPEDKACAIAQDDVDGVRDADVFIIVGDHSGTGMYVELGIALATNTKVYSLGTNNDVTVFHFLPSVTRVDSFEEILADLGS